MSRLATLGGTLGRGGIPPTPPFRRALAWDAKIFLPQITIHIWNYNSTLNSSAIADNLII